MITTKLHTFEPGAMSIIQMGEQLIGHASTALGELVKNAYDADALECKVYIHLDKDIRESFVMVFDEGLGMNENTLFGEWLQPSMSSKRIGKKKSKLFKRNYLGSKGIGRLAAMALGQYLTVVSKTAEEKQYNWIQVDREEFKKDILLSKIHFPGGKINNIDEVFKDASLLKSKSRKRNDNLITFLENKINNKFIEGTLIIIENVDSSVLTIMTKDFEDEETPIEESSIMMSLRSLITPLYQIASSQDELLKENIIDDIFYKKQVRDKFDLYYGVRFDQGYFAEKIETGLEPVEALKFIEEYDYRLIGIFNSKGEVISNYHCKRLGEKYKEDEKIILDKKYLYSDEPLRKRRKKEIEEIPEEIMKSNIGEFYFDIRVFDRDIDSIDRLSKILKQSGRLETRRLLDKLVGLRVAKNNFSIKPYGDQDKDWMELGQMRVQEPVQVLGPNQILGYIFLFSPENDGLIEKTNREGFFENTAFVDLKKILRGILIRLGRNRAMFRLKHNIGRVISSKLKRPDTEAYIRYLTNMVPDKNVIKKSEDFLREITTSLDNMEQTLTFSQRLATMGSGLELVYHELAQPITVLGGTRDSIQSNTSKISDEKLSSIFHRNVGYLDSSIDTLNTLKVSLKPAIGISRPKPFKPIDTFKKVCFLYTSDINKLDIQITCDPLLDEYSIKDYEYALWIAFLNIINNAIYWLQFTEDKRNINFKIEKKNILIVQNTSPIIPSNSLDIIFEYGVTMKQTKNATGLGLAFTRSILSSHDWEIWAENRKEGPAFLMKKMEE